MVIAHDKSTMSLERMGSSNQENILVSMCRGSFVLCEKTSFQRAHGSPATVACCRLSPWLIVGVTAVRNPCIGQTAGRRAWLLIAAHLVLLLPRIFLVAGSAR